MSLQATLTAQLVTGPSQSSCTDNPFPGVANTIPFGLNPANKSYNVEAGGVISVASPSSFGPIASVGTGGQVTQGLTLYLRTTTEVQVQLTLATPGGGADTVSIVPLQGVMLLEFPSDGYLKLLAVKGQASIEYWVSGAQ